MNEAKFWEIIRGLKWKSDFDYKRIGEELLNTNLISLENRQKFCVIADTIENQLFQKLDNLDEKLYKKYIAESDDGLSDLIAHVIGLGKTKYYKCFNNGKVKKDYSDLEELKTHTYWQGTEPYVENFYYALQPMKKEFGYYEVKNQVIVVEKKEIQLEKEKILRLVEEVELNVRKINHMGDLMKYKEDLEDLLGK